MKNLYSENYIMLNLINYRKDLFNILKKNCLFDSENLKFVVFENKIFLAVGFDLYSYFSLKEDIYDFLYDNDIFFNIIFVRYRKANFSLELFEDLLSDDLSFQLFEEDDALVFTEILILQKVLFYKMNLFLMFSILVNANNLIKCPLFIKQHQN